MGTTHSPNLNAACNPSNAFCISFGFTVLLRSRLGFGPGLRLNKTEDDDLSPVMPIGTYFVAAAFLAGCRNGIAAAEMV